MMHSILIRLACAASAVGAVACASPSHVDQHWGESVMLNTSTMIANPEAGSSAVLTGLDPVTGQKVADRYYQSQTAQDARDVRSEVVSE